MFEKATRREFLRTAAGGIAVSWGGLRIFAGPQGFAESGQSDQPHIHQKFFVYGSAFYRPPNPPASERRAMLKTLAQEYKFNTIRIYSSWVYHNPEQDRFEFGELQEVMRYCDEFGIKVLMGVILEDAPWWLEAAHPETRYVNANDHAQRLEGSGIIQNLTMQTASVRIRRRSRRVVKRLVKTCRLCATPITCVSLTPDYLLRVAPE